MKHKILFLLVITSFMVMSLANATATTYLPQKQNNLFELTINSDNASVCNLSYVQYPNGVKTYFNSPMTKNGQSFNITLNGNNYTQLGDTCHGITCNDGTSNEVGSICRTVTPSGFNNLTTFLFIFLIIISLVFLLGVKTENSWIMMLGGILVLLFGLFIVIYGIDLIKDTRTTWAIGLIIWAIGIYCIYLSVEEQLKHWG